MKAARIYLGLLLAAMALGQMLSLGRFVEAMGDYGVGAVAPLLAVVLIVGEAGAAAGLLGPVGPRPRRLAALAGLGVAALWGALAVQALARGLDFDNCGCFGAYLSQPLTLWVLPQDALFLVLAGAVVRGATRHPAAARPRPRPASPAPLN